MKRVYICLLFFCLLGWQCKESTEPEQMEEVDNRTLLEKLNDIPGATVTELQARDHFSRLFEIFLTQPVDHQNPDGPSFQQKIYIGHVDETLPVVFETEGYSRASFRLRDLSPMLQCNQITVEHRYNGDSKPASPDWQYLTIRQAADDLHKIVTHLKEIYSAGWVSSGRSKGGETAVFHRRFYPDDVDATVAFVAPLLFSADDQRFKDYLNTVGDTACRNKIKQFQRAVLLKADSVASFLPGWVDWINQNFGTNMTFSISSKDVIKHAAMDYPFEFWSSTSHTCGTIPDTSANAETLFFHLVEVVEILLFYTDYGTDFWEGWYYQAQTEIGDFKFDNSHIDDLLHPLPVLHNFGNNLLFDPSIMQDVDNWVKTEGEKMIFIYGSDDPWSIAQFEIGNQDAIKVINPGTKHGTTVLDLSAENQALVMGKLAEWLNYDVPTF